MNYAANLRTLIELPSIIDESDDLTPYVIATTEEALREWRKFQQIVETGMREGAL